MAKIVAHCTNCQHLLVAYNQTQGKPPNICYARVRALIQVSQMSRIIYQGTGEIVEANDQDCEMYKPVYDPEQYHRKYLREVES